MVLSTGYFSLCMPGKNSTTLQNSWLTVLKTTNLRVPSHKWGVCNVHQDSVTRVEKGQKSFQEPEVRRGGEQQQLLDLTGHLCNEHTVAVLTCTGAKQPTVWSMEGGKVGFL